ncbi:MAG TPA: hypothetical protein DCY13_11095 [Verrucomicrobiales bacterium]|nr:hypothetical protein [Verrucomicrobiales bacterium]
MKHRFRTALFAVTLPLLTVAESQAADHAWQTAAGHRLAPLKVSADGRTGFTLLSTSETGVTFTNELQLLAAGKNQNLMSGAGVAAGDIDGDGLPDLYFCNVEGNNRLYRNLGGFKFEDITGKAGVACEGMFSVGATFADLNGDSHLDLYVASNDGPNAYFVGDGKGGFTNLTKQAGLELHRLGCTTVAVADVNGDGHLDLYVGAYGENTVLRGGADVSYTTDRYGNTRIRGRHARRLVLENGLLSELGDTNILFLNNGNNTFTVQSWTDGTFKDEDGKPLTSAPLDLTLTAMFRDINQDGHPDIYECNDFQTPDRFWLNDGTGKFQAVDRLAIRSVSVFSMGVAFADLNHDGWDDFLTCDMLSQYHELRMQQQGQTNPIPVRPGIIDDRMQIRRNTLFINRGDGTYAEIANYAGLQASDWSWMPIFMDVDMDGWEDMLVSNGHAYDTQDHDAGEKKMSMGTIPSQMAHTVLQHYPKLLTPNVAFRNQQDLTFKEMGADWGFNSTQVTHGFVQVDLDLDGDMDLVGNCLNNPALVYRNETPAPRVAVKLKGKAPNTQGIGARVKLLGGAVPSQQREVQGGGHYLSGGEPLLSFATGASTSMTIEVTWRSGKRSVVTGVRPNHIYEIDEASAGAAAPSSIPPVSQSLFADFSKELNHTHHEETYDDFARQPLLYKKLSQLGPGIAWADLDGDGDDDLAIGAGLGGNLGVFRNDGQGKLTAWEDPAWATPNIRDQIGLAALPGSSGTELLVGWSNYEDGLELGPAVHSLRFTGSKVELAQEIPTTLTTTGPLAVADLDGTGSFVLFVGGRVLPGRFPEAVSSRLFRRNSGGWVEDVALSAAFKQLGLISAATFSDLNGDGKPELVLAVEWGPIQVYGFDGTAFVDRTESLGLAAETGWWQSVTAGDFDGDGRLDIVAGNVGLNNPFKPTRDNPTLAYHADLNGLGTREILLAYREPKLGKIVPRWDRKELDPVLPALRFKFPRHKDFSTAGIADILGDRYSSTPRVAAVQMANVVFMNRGDRFEPVELPGEAQWAPVFGINVADFDGNGTEDIFLAQNFFAASTSVPRYDAGRGLLLLGDGKGGFTIQTSRQSGILVWGESRGSAASDYDGDGRTDLVVSQNGTETKLYRNELAKPGLRVRLKGGPVNPSGIGAAIRLIADGKLGPSRELRAGSGYLSQDSLVQVMHSAKPATAIQVAWPGGKSTTSTIPSGAREVEISETGDIRLVR